MSLDELIALRGIVKKVQAAGKNKIEYKDYATTSGEDPYKDVAGNSAKKGYGSSTSDAWSAPNTAVYALKTTLGQASIVVKMGKYSTPLQVLFTCNRFPRSTKSQNN